MAEELTQEQLEQSERLAASRREGQEKQKTGVIEQVAETLNFPKKIGRHWLIIAVAVLFDIFALIPFISVVINACFGMILFLYFGPKSKGGEFTKIALPIAIGSIFDFFLSFLPINTGAALIRITLD